MQRQGGAEPRPQPPPPPHHHHPETLLVTHAAAGGDGDLDGVSARLADVLQVERFVGGLVVAALNGERCGVDAHLHGGRPVGVHLPVLVVVALELQLQVRPGGAGRGVGRGAGRGCAHTRATVPGTTVPYSTMLCQATPRTTAPYGTITNRTWVPPQRTAPCRAKPSHITYHRAIQHYAVPSHGPVPPRIQHRALLSHAVTWYGTAPCRVPPCHTALCCDNPRSAPRLYAVPYCTVLRQAVQLHAKQHRTTPCRAAPCPPPAAPTSS